MLKVKDTLRATVNLTFDGRVIKNYHGPDARARFEMTGATLTERAEDVIAAVDASFASSSDDALLAYPATQNDDMNFLGRTRANLPSYRQTAFVVNLMNGTAFGGAVDPRMSRMLSPSPDGNYRGLDINTIGFGALTTTPEYASEEFLVAMGHLYHHLNTAWNGREASPERTARAAREDFDAWRQFPSNEELLLD